MKAVALAGALLAGLAAAHIPVVGHHQRSSESRIQLLEDEIRLLENALQQALFQLANLYNGHTPLPWTYSSPPLASSAAAPSQSTPVNTLTALASTDTVDVSFSIGGLPSSLSAASSGHSLAAPSTTAGNPTLAPNLASTSISNHAPQHSQIVSPAITSSITGAVVQTSTFQNSSRSASGSNLVILGTAGPTASCQTSAPAIPPPVDVSAMSSTSCASLCSSLTFPSSLAAHPISCVPYAANSTITIQGGQATATCGSTITPPVDLCRVVLSITTSPQSQVYMEVWLPDGTTAWNGRTMSTDNTGVNGCVAFNDMQYVVGLGFAAIGDNGGHNGSSFDGSWLSGSNELVLDWAGRARHAATVAGKAVVNQFYNKAPSYSYYIGCSAGGWQGLISAQSYPNDFNGIIAGSSATDFNHLQAWSGRFIQMTGLNSTDPRFLTLAQWVSVQSAIFAQCDQALDGVNDGILEDPTLCNFDTSVLSNSTYNLTSTQVTTVYNVFTELYNTKGNLLFPALLYGSQVDAFRLGQLSGSIQGISSNWYKYAVVNDSNWNPLNMNQSNYARADQLDAYHGNVSGYSGNLGSFSKAGGKLIMYHGMADPLVSEGVSQRYYLKVAKNLGISNSGMDDFLRLFRISGMAHCGVGGISGAGAWMFGQNQQASAAPNSIIQYLQDWVEKASPPDRVVGTKFWYDTPSYGVQLQRAHCRFPYRTTYIGGGADPTKTASWNCTLIANWQQCGVGTHPRLCNSDGTFTP